MGLLFTPGVAALIAKAYDEQEQRRSQERWDRRIKNRETFYAEMAGLTDPLARAVLDLHARGGESFYAECDGCDFSGYEGEPPEWPCRTVRAIADHFHIREEGE